MGHMDPKRWKQVDNVLQSVLDLPPGEREAFLRRACAGDELIEGEVRSLLLSEESAGRFLENPAMEVAARALAPRRGDVQSDETELIDSSIGRTMIGRTISHYCISEQLGSGGMGVVYKAEDTRLHRFVALKFLSDEFAHDPGAVNRFRREARAASALNHPNICTIHDIGEQDGRSFIVMEYVEGMTLKQRLAESRLDVETVLALGIAIADALDAAHTIGILHRDIKPGNIAITQGGRAKILDFGLAQLLSPVDASGDAGETVTKQGTVLGTAGYMSPEQMLGEPLDERSDIFSFALVLYEMAAGKRPVGAVDLDGITPPELRRIVSKCLQNDRELRYGHASEIRTDLQRLKQDMDSGRLTAVPAAKRRAPLVLVAAAMLALSPAAYFYLRRSPKFTNKDSIVLADFKNTTGDPVFDGTLRQGLAVQLQQSPFLSLVSDQRVQKGLRLMGRPADAPLTPELAKEICERTAAWQCSKARLPASEASTCWGCARRTAARGKSSMRSRRKRREKKTS